MTHSSDSRKTKRRAGKNNKKKTTKRGPSPGCRRFPEVKGKTVESVELWIDSDQHAIVISFQDRTCLHFDLEPELAVNTGYFDWKRGEQRVIKSWPPLRNVRRVEFRVP